MRCLSLSARDLFQAWEGSGRCDRPQQWVGDAIGRDLSAWSLEPVKLLPSGRGVWNEKIREAGVEGLLEEEQASRSARPWGRSTSRRKAPGQKT